MKSQKCISCGQRLNYLGETKDAKIYQCPECGMGVTLGEVPDDQYNAYHRDSVYVSAKDQFKNIFSKRVEIISKFKNGGKALEIGSSTGLFLSLLQEKGWEVLGIEPSSPAVKIARQREIPILNTTFEQANLVRNSFDVVIFNHVLEHMEDPVAIIRKAKNLLRKKGIIFIDVPNFASLSARLGGAGWQYILPKEHRWHFTPASLFHILEKASLQPLYWEAHSGIWGYGSPRQEVWESLRSLKKRFIADVVTAIPTYVLTKLKAGTGLTIVAQKM